MEHVAISLLLVFSTLAGALNGGSDGRVRWPKASPSKLGKFSRAAVASDAVPCSQIGSDVMRDGGSAVDAAVAARLCIGVVHPQSAGIGGGFFMTVYDPASGQARVLDAREVAPMATTDDMFHGDKNATLYGGLAVAVPGELAGLWEAHQRYGRLPWRRLVEPSIQLAQEGLATSQHMSKYLAPRSKRLKKEASMSHFFDAETGEALKLGQLFRQPVLADTLRLVAQHGAEVLYNGSLSDGLVAAIAGRGGIVTRRDLADYRPQWLDAVRVDLRDNLTLLTTPPPASGLLVALALNVLDRFKSRMTEAGAASDPLTYHRMAEAMKHAFGWRPRLGDPSSAPDASAALVRRMTSDRLADEIAAKIDDGATRTDASFYGAQEAQPEDKGTSHVSVLDADGLAVAVTSSVNDFFGAGFATDSGIILNGQMANFAIAGVLHHYGVVSGAANKIGAGKKPLSSMSPSVLIDRATNRTRMVVGASGGTRIVSAVINTIVRHLWFGETLKEAVDRPRLHHQLQPMRLEMQTDFPAELAAALQAKGHKMFEIDGSIVSAVSVADDGAVLANADWRKFGQAAGFDAID